MKLSRMPVLLTLITAALVLTGSAAMAAVNPALAGKKLLFVGGTTQEARAFDEAPQRFLASLGFAVTFADQAGPGSLADNQDVVVVSSTTASRIVAAKFRDTRAAVVLMESFVADDMGISGLRQGIDYGEEKKNSPVMLVNAPHPMQAGMPNGMIPVHKGKTPSLHWGRPANGATVIAVVAGEPDKAAIYGYDKGALMGDNFAAPARRVVLFVNTATFTEINDDGLRLTAAALAWAAGAL